MSVVAAIATVTSLAIPALSSAHSGSSKCAGELVEVGSTYEGHCEFPFQGFPIGVAGVYTAGDPARNSEIHVEVLAKVGVAPPRPIGVECDESGDEPVARCTAEYNPLTAPITAIEPVPQEIVALYCNAHTHAIYSKFKPPSGEFACWSTNEARADLEADGEMPDIEG